MKKSIYVLSFLCLIGIPFCYPAGNINPPSMRLEPTDKILELSQQKWEWIMQRQTDSLDILFHEKLLASEPAIRMDKAGYIDVVENGFTRYQHVDILETDIQTLGDLSILLTKVRLTLPDGQEEPQLREVTEVYKKHNRDWKLILFQMNPNQQNSY